MGQKKVTPFPIMDLNALATLIQTEHPVPATWPPAPPSASAVLAILFPLYRKPHVLLMRRSENLRVHAGEISFPGGTLEANDANLLATALRETREELDLDIASTQVLGLLPEVQTLTGFTISPFITILDNCPQYSQNQDEVQEVLKIPLQSLLATGHREMGYPKQKQMVAFWFLRHRVWGATAKIINYIGRLANRL